MNCKLDEPHHIKLVAPHFIGNSITRRRKEKKKFNNDSIVRTQIRTFESVGINNLTILCQKRKKNEKIQSRRVHRRIKCPETCNFEEICQENRKILSYL